VWDALLPEHAWTDGATEHTTGQADALRLSLPTPAGAASSTVEASVLGVAHALEPNEAAVSAVTLDRDAAGRLHAVLTVAERDHVVPFGYGEWHPTTLSLPDTPADVATAAAWTDETTLHGRMLFLGTPFEWRTELRFSGDEVAVTIDRNVAFGERALLNTTGRARRG